MMAQSSIIDASTIVSPCQGITARKDCSSVASNAGDTPMPDGGTGVFLLTPKI